MKSLLDTNIIADFLLDRIPFAEYADSILQATVGGKVRAFLSANSITDIYYIIRKKLSDWQARQHLMELLAIFEIAPVTGEDCLQAIRLEVPDFEDALQIVCAKKAQVDFLVTRDEALLSICEMAIRPADFLALLQEGNLTPRQGSWAAGDCKSGARIFSSMGILRRK